MQQRRLAGAGLTEQGDALAGADGEGEIAAEHVSSNLKTQVVDQQDRRAHSLASRERRVLRRRMIRKAGTPMTAVTTPTGSCSGDMTERAKLSAMTRKLPPSSTAAGISTRWSRAPSSLSMWGITSP